MDNIHPIGHIAYKNVRFLKYGNTAYTHTNRIAHIKIKVEKVETVGFPIPLSAAPMISLIPQRKYVLEIMTIPSFTQKDLALTAYYELNSVFKKDTVDENASFIYGIIFRNLKNPK